MIHRAGDDALVVIEKSFSTRLNIATRLRATNAWREVVPGRNDVTVQFDSTVLAPIAAKALLIQQLASIEPGASLTPVQHQFAVALGGAHGPDMLTVAEATQRSVTDIAAMLCGHQLRVEMLGFTPGFAYLSGIASGIEINRLASPRQRVPAGSIGLITGQLGLYALDGPAGWPIIGRVIDTLFDASSATPFLLSAGDTVTLRVDPG